MEDRVQNLGRDLGAGAFRRPDGKSADGTSDGRDGRIVWVLAFLWQDFSR